MTAISRSSALLCAAVALPAFAIGWALLQGEPWRYGIRPTGDISAKLLVLTLCLGPLRKLAPRSAWLGWAIARRRIFGLCAFGYALFHLVVFCASIGRLDWIVQGMAFASMWTGWIAFALLLAVAGISNATAMAWLGPWWKRLQRLAHPAAAFTLAHWLLLSRSPTEALLHAMPVAILWLVVATARLSSAAGTGINRPE